MTKSTFMLFAVGYYVFSLIIVIVALYIINYKIKKHYKSLITDLEREKNLVVSAAIMSELNKVEALVNNDELKKQYDEWNKRFDDIKNVDLPKITDSINEMQQYFDDRNDKELKRKIIDTEMELNYLKTKADYLLSEIKEIICSRSL